MSESSYLTHPSQAPGSQNTDGLPDLGGNGTAINQQALTDRMAQGAHRTVDRLAETAAPHVERMEGALAGAAAQLKDQARHALDRGDEWAEELRTSVRRNPLSAVAISLAVGALIARITR